MYKKQLQKDIPVIRKSFLHTQPPIYTVKSVQLMHMSDQDVIDQSKSIINNSAAVPQLNGGLLDPHLGSMTDTQQCSSCNNTRIDCQGHSGHFPLVHPYISPYMYKFVLKIIKRLCLDCVTITGENKKCHICGKKAATIKLQRDHKFILTFDGKDFNHTPASLKELFSRIDFAELKQLGLNTYPEQMILSNVFISPILTRPDKKIQASTVQNDGFTGCLSTIIRIGNLLNKMNENDPQFDHTYSSFLRAINNYYIDTNKDDYQKSSQKSLQTLLSGKEGTIRGKIMGKQVCKLGRGIIACNTRICADEVIIPQQFAMTVFIKEKVQSYNYSRLEKLFKNGPTQYPGANYIRKPNGNEYQIGNSKVTLEIGDVLYRHQQNGDSVLMNRQPTLLPMSIGNHKIQVAKTNQTDTLDLNVISSQLYNFDFDGFAIHL